MGVGLPFNLKMNKIAIIGAGQLGSRHLQSIAKYKSPLEIYVIDPSKEALDMAFSRYNEIFRIVNIQHVINLFQSLTELPKEIDLAVIACNSMQRRSIIEELYERSHAKYLILEKFLFPKINDYLAVEAIFKKYNVTAWVNCSRRMYSDYQNLKKIVQDDQEYIIQVTAGNLGLASNSIHYLDLFSFLGAKEPYIIQCDNLKPEVFKSKREGYIDFFGTLTVRTTNGILTISSFPDSSYPITVSISTPFRKIYIQETLKPHMAICDKETNWNPNILPFKVQFQSELTHLAVNEIFEHNTCSLTPYSESVMLHLVMLQSFTSFLEKISGNTIEVCPIT
jgi:predicted dehydrogenase